MTPAEDDLAAIAEAVGPPLGEWALEGAAEVDAHPVPGLPEQAVWRVRREDLDHPIQAYVGLWPDGTARVLNDDQPAFLRLVETHGVEIDDPETATGYVIGFLEVTRGPAVIVRVVSGPEDIRWRPGTEEEEARRDEFLSDSQIAPPSAEETGEGFQVQVSLVVDQRIQRNSFQVARDGSLAAEFRVIAADLPLPIAR